MTYTIKVDSSVGDQIAEQVLLGDYQGILTDINRLQSQDNLKPYQQQDLENDIEVRDAMEKVLTYYVHDWRSKLEGMKHD